MLICSYLHRVTCWYLALQLWLMSTDIIKKCLEYWKFPRAQWSPSLWNSKKYNQPRAGHSTKLSNQAGRTLIRELPKNPMITWTELQSSLAEMGEPARRTTLYLQHFTNLGFMGEWPNGSHSWEIGRWRHTWNLQKGSEIMRQKILLSDETNILLLALCIQAYVGRTRHCSSPV